MTPQSATAFAAVLEAHTGQQLAASRRWRIETALAPLMRARGLPSLDHLARLLAAGTEAALVPAVIEALLNNETYFYREPTTFDLLDVAMARLRDSRAATRRLRFWCAGCSTGQEAYSLAMRLADDERWAGWTIDITGSDVSAAAIARARAGLYSQFEIQRGLPVRQMLRWFDSEGEEWRAKPELRGKVHFHVHNLLETTPLPGRYDVILCRNVLLYFSLARRGAVFEGLARACTPDGVLMLGAGETVIGQTERFVSDREHRGLYRLAQDCDAPPRPANTTSVSAG
jgi:chemotaxis protein methyltransferase CheR